MTLLEVADFIVFLMAGISCGLAVWAYRHGLPGEWRRFHGAVAALSIIYFVFYVWLVIGHPDGALWSARARGVGLVSWPVVWWGSSLLSIHSQQRLKKLHAVVRKYETELPDDPEGMVR